ncbi:MAG: hypothetical protein DESF_01840 [Desulfovibrio sp.]
MKAMFLALAVVLFVPFKGAKAEEPPPALVKAIAQQESGLNPLAINVAGNRTTQTRRKRRNG